MAWLKALLILLVALAVVVGALGAYGASRWVAATRARPSAHSRS